MQATKHKKIWVYNRIPFSSDYQDVIKFHSKAEQENYFDSLNSTIYHSDKYSQILRNGNILVEGRVELFETAKYLRFENTVDSITYHAFILDVSYINEHTTELIFEIDVWQTYHLALLENRVSGVVEQSHLPLFTPNGDRNILPIPQGFSIGNKVLKKQTRVPLDIEWLVIVAKPSISIGGEVAQGGYVTTHKQLRYFILPIEKNSPFVPRFTHNNVTYPRMGLSRILRYLVSTFNETTNTVNQIVNMYVSNYCGYDFEVDEQGTVLVKDSSLSLTPRTIGDRGTVSGGSGGIGNVDFNSDPNKVPWDKGGLELWGNELGENLIKKIIALGQSYKILPSFVVVQLNFESLWGDSTSGRLDNNWGGITYPYSAGKPDIKRSLGSPRPADEGGNYVRYESVEDFLEDYFYLLRKGNLYNVVDKTTFDESVRGLFIEGGAKADYAALGYTAYVQRMHERRSAIENANPSGILEAMDDMAFNPIDENIISGSDGNITPEALDWASQRNFSYIGDSLMVGMETPLKDKVGRANGQARGSMQLVHASDPSLDGSKITKSLLYSLHDYVVVVLGTNAGLNENDVRNYANLLSQKKVFWLNTASRGVINQDRRDNVTNEIKKVSRTHAGVYLLDWDKYVTDNNKFSEYYGSDEVHLTPAGYEAMANFTIQNMYNIVQNSIGDEVDSGAWIPSEPSPTLIYDLDKVFEFMEQKHKEHATYSMTGSRNGTDGTGDCSGMLSQGLYNAGMKPYIEWQPNSGIRLPSTETLHDYLLGNGWELVSTNDPSFKHQKYDIFIHGQKGYSSGGDGHTGMFNSDKNITHWTYGANGYSNSPYYTPSSGWEYIYRCTTTDGSLYNGQGSAVNPTIPIDNNISVTVLEVSNKVEWDKKEIELDNIVDNMESIIKNELGEHFESQLLHDEFSEVKLLDYYGNMYLYALYGIPKLDKNVIEVNGAVADTNITHVTIQDYNYLGIGVELDVVEGNQPILEPADYTKHEHGFIDKNPKSMTVISESTDTYLQVNKNQLEATQSTFNENKSMLAKQIAFSQKDVAQTNKENAYNAQYSLESSQWGMAQTGVASATGVLGNLLSFNLGGALMSGVNAGFNLNNAYRGMQNAGQQQQFTGERNSMRTEANALANMQAKLGLNQSVRNFNASLKDLQNQPDTIVSLGNDIAYQAGNNLNDYFLQYKTARFEILKQANEYFKLFGLIQNRFVDDVRLLLEVREKWNYLKMTTVNLGSLPLNHIHELTLKTVLLSGVRVWEYQSDIDFLNFNQDNLDK